VAGYAVMRVDPAVVAVESAHAPDVEAPNVVAQEPAFAATAEPGPASEEVQQAFT
jgi:3-oxoacyl-[acyl-carrier-protein] synthase-3